MNTGKFEGLRPTILLCIRYTTWYIDQYNYPMADVYNITSWDTQIADFTVVVILNWLAVIVEEGVCAASWRWNAVLLTDWIALLVVFQLN